MSICTPAALRQDFDGTGVWSILNDGDDGYLMKSCDRVGVPWSDCWQPQQKLLPFDSYGPAPEH